MCSKNLLAATGVKFTTRSAERILQHRDPRRESAESQPFHSLLRGLRNAAPRSEKRSSEFTVTKILGLDQMQSFYTTVYTIVRVAQGSDWLDVDILPIRSRRLTRLSTSARDVALWSELVITSSLSETTKKKIRRKNKK